MSDESVGSAGEPSEEPSTPDASAIGRTGSTRLGFDRSLFGLEERRTALTLRTLLALWGLYALSALTRGELRGGTLQTLSPTFDALSTVLILVGLFVATLGPIGYAIWNGGPILAFAIALAPELVGELFAFRWTLDLDLAVSLTTGAAGAAAALAVTGVRTRRSQPGEPLSMPSRQHVLAVGIVVAGSAGAVTRFALQAPTRVLSAYRPFALYWLVPLAVGALFAVSLRRRGA
ncbi:hypothetical protein Halru_0071 [Halovivax ruber XH-70]|uniref:Uncharacterized protein n=1 Tax=Halovivax ruber (strain DSM 18193 / JCM 13892 / XH-70) TaxID=797302 RepID=L0I7G1_HALRX|nr:hypothetical protein [Halovivax ruber]AGB14723.1 hypothetical protein Halru_0071 [Halovivax ruber XH-70]